MIKSGAVVVRGQRLQAAAEYLAVDAAAMRFPFPREWAR
jgi:hypothetical protein